MAWAPIAHLILLPLLFMYIPIPLAWAVVGVAFILNCFFLFNASKSFHYLGSNHRPGQVHTGLFLLYFLLMYIGAAFHVSQGSSSLLIVLLLIGLVPWLRVGYKSWHACIEAHSRQLKARLKSVDLESGIYDAHSDSLHFVDLSDAILQSSSAWKWFFFLAIGMIPGPVLGVLAGNSSTDFRYIAALPVTWGIMLFYGYLALRLGFDYWVIRKIESENRVRLMLSTSPLNPARAPGG